MQKINIYAPPLPLYETLESINGISFTPREIDMIACIMHGRGTKAAASLLSIEGRTIETHIGNLMRKAGCNSRQHLRDIMERSDKASLLHNHYRFLITRAEFEKRLQDIAALKAKKGPTCCLIKRADYEDTRLSEELIKHLEQAGVHITRIRRDISQRAAAETHPITPETADYNLYMLPENMAPSLDSVEVEEEILKASHETTTEGIRIYLIIKGREDTQSQEDLGYYDGVFELLQIMMPSIKLEAIADDFKKTVTNIGIKATLPTRGDFINISKGTPAKALYPKRWLSLLITVLLSLIGGTIIGWALSIDHRYFLNFISSPDSIQSDLFVPPDPIFLERPELIAQMKQKLKSQHTIPTLAVVGIGGAGKTTLARYYASLQKASVIWELNAETPRSLARSFEKLAYALARREDEKKALERLQEIKNPKERQEKILVFVQERLKVVPKWFLIYDNVEVFNDIQPYFPTTSALWGRGSVIVTTRDTTMKDNAHMHDVLTIGPLREHEQQRLFINIMNKAEEHPLTREQEEKAKQFLKEIPPFPLDTVMAAFYLKATGIPYTEYLERLREYRAEFDHLQGTILAGASEYDKTRYGIIMLSLDQLISANKDFGDLFIFLSLLDASDIPRELLVSYKERDVVDNFIYNLKKFSFIDDKSLPCFQAVPSYSMHRSLQEFGLAYLVKAFNLKKGHSLIQTIATVFENYLTAIIDKEDVLRIRLLVSHCESFLSHRPLLTSALQGSLEGDLGVLYFYTGDYPKARDTLEDALNILNKAKGNNLSKVAYILSYVGSIYGLLNDNVKSKDTLERSLAIYKKCFPHNHSKIAQVLSRLGNTYKALGEYEKARASLEQSVTIYHNHLPDDHINLAWVFLFLGYIEADLGHYVKAKKSFEQSLFICKTYLPNNPVKMAWALANVGNMYRALGRYEKAKELIEESLSLCKDNLPDDHRGIGWALSYLGIVCCELGQYDEARKVFAQALSILEKQLSKQQTMVAWILWNQGILEGKCGHYQKAKSLLEQTLAAVEKQYGPRFFKVAHVLSDLGYVYLLEGDTEKAESLFNRALDIYHHNTHPERYKTLEYMAELQMKKSQQARDQGDQQQAEEFRKQAIRSLEQALTITKTNFPADCPHIARIQGKLEKIIKDVQSEKN